MTNTVDFTSLTTHANQLFSSLTRFQTLLEQEASFLKSNQVDQLPSLLEEKSQLSVEVNNIFQSFIDQIPQDNSTLDQLTESEIFQTFPSGLQQQVTSIIEKINLCHDLNLSNGMTVQILSNLNQVSLNILTGQGNTDSSSYGASGEKHKAKNKTTLGQA